MKLPSWVENPNPNLYLESDYVTLDFETTNHNKGTALDRTNRLILATWVGASAKLSVSRQLLQVHHAFGDEYHQKELTDAVSSTGILVAHNAKFELQWLQRCGIEIGSKLVWDTMLAEFVIAGNRRFDLSLDGTAKRWGIGAKKSLVSRLIEGGICPSEIPESWLLEYGCEDTALCHAIFLKQREYLAAEGLLGVMYTRCLLTPVLADIETRGVQLDAKRVKEEYEQTADLLRSTTDTLQTVAGGINWNSPQQVAELVYGQLGFKELTRRGQPDRTPTDRPKTGDEVLAKLSANTGSQRTFLESFKAYKKLEKKLSTLEKLVKCVVEDGGRLYAQYNQAVAGTQRLSSNGLKHKIQFQNIDGTLKGLFKSRNDGWLVGEADAVQLEFRVAAHLGRDVRALSDIRTPSFDIHWQTAEVFTKKDRKDLTGAIRKAYKAQTFSPLYGATGGQDPRRKAYIKFFQENYKGIYETQTNWTYEVLKTKKLRTETGLVFYWPDTRVESGSYIRNRTAIFNYPVQNFASAELVSIALTYFWHRAKALGLKLFIVNTIHDSIIVELPKDEVDAFTELARQCFTSDCFNYLNSVYSIHFNSPLGVESRTGGRWGEGQEVKYDADPESLNLEGP